uniref:Uncharacterized protein n=1 Tax=Arundo donax TaxID=35708 RepID=A0A0A9CC83_ARUDO
MAVEHGCKQRKSQRKDMTDRESNPQFQYRKLFLFLCLPSDLHLLLQK